MDASMGGWVEGCMDGWRDAWMDGWDGWMDGWMRICLYVCMYVYVCMYGCMDVWMYGCMNVWMYALYVWMYVCMYVCVVWPHTKHASRHDNRQAAKDMETLVTTQHARKFLAKRDSLTHDGNQRKFCHSWQSVTSGSRRHVPGKQNVYWQARA